MKNPTIVVALLLLSFFLPAQNISEKLEVYESNYSSEKIYISHDKPAYFLGDTLWGSLYFIDGRTHAFIKDTTLIHLQWIDETGHNVYDHILESTDGKCAFELPLDVDNAPGTFTLRAYTSYQLNFSSDYQFSKEIKVYSDRTLEEPTPEQSEDLVIRFYPEGGHLVNGLSSRIAFTANDENGNAKRVTGTLIDKEGNVISNIKTLIPGMGYFEMTPNDDLNFLSVKFQDETRKYELPTPLKGGFTLSVDARKKDKINLKIGSTKEIKGSRILGHLRGQIFMDKILDASNELVINKKAIPSGVLHFTLFDKDEKPVAERLVYNENNTEKLDLNISLDNQTETRALQSLTIEGLALSEKNIGHANIKVYNSELNDLDNAITIENYLLLQSDLSQRIDKLNTYFAGDINRNNAKKDLLLMTLGWRKFKWQDVSKLQVPEILHPKEKNMSLAGLITKKGGKKAVKAEMIVTMISDDQFSNINHVTENDGLFYFKGLDLKQPTNILIQAAKYNEKRAKKVKDDAAKLSGSRFVDIHPYDLNENIFKRNEKSLINLFRSDQKMKSLSNQLMITSKDINPFYQPDWSILFEEVTIRAKRKSKYLAREKETKKKFKDIGVWYSTNSPTFYPEDLPGNGNTYLNIYEMLRSKVPGIDIIGNTGNYRIRVRGTNSIQNPVYASIMLNGSFISDQSAEMINPGNIVAINMLRSITAAAIYGGNGAGGVISIVTDLSGKQLTDASPTLGVLNIDHPGYFEARSFYMPDYNTQSAMHDLPDIRTTLYWDPMVELTAEPQEHFFFTGDVKGAFDVVVEGITGDGKVFYEVKTFIVE